MGALFVLAGLMMLLGAIGNLANPNAAEQREVYDAYQECSRMANAKSSMDVSKTRWLERTAWGQRLSNDRYVVGGVIMPYGFVYPEIQDQREFACLVRAGGLGAFQIVQLYIEHTGGVDQPIDLGRTAEPLMEWRDLTADQGSQPVLLTDPHEIADEALAIYAYDQCSTAARLRSVAQAGFPWSNRFAAIVRRHRDNIFVVGGAIVDYPYGRPERERAFSCTMVLSQSGTGLISELSLASAPGLAPSAPVASPTGEPVSVWYGPAFVHTR